MQVEPFARKSFRRWFQRGDVIGKSGVKAAPGILVAPYAGDEFISAARYLTSRLRRNTFFSAGHCGKAKKRRGNRFHHDEAKRIMLDITLCETSCDQSIVSSSAIYSVPKKEASAISVFYLLEFILFSFGFFLSIRIKNSQTCLRLL